MKKVVLLLGLFLTIFITKAQSNDKTSINQLVNLLQDKFNVSISYDGDIKLFFTADEERDILSKKNIEQALSALVAGRDITYQRLRNDYFVITKKKDIPSKGNTTPSDSLKRTIRGIVYDDAGNPLPGATVLEKGTQNFVLTDLDGKFIITVSSKAKAIEVRYLGMKTQVITLTKKNFYEIYLEPSSVNLGEIVVAGVAGRTPRKKLTITVNHIGSDEINEAPASNAISALQGKIPGATIVMPSGEPGRGPAIRLRGVTSMLGRNAPLIIVDGVMVETSLADFNADDIASIEVVKGAAASALYGSRAAGGVIVINTKRGKSLKVNSYEVTVRNEFGNSQLGKRIKLATHHPYVLDSNYQDYPYTRYAGVLYDDQGNVISGSRILTPNAYCDQPYAVIYDHQRLFFKRGNYYTNYAGIGVRTNISNIYLSVENHHDEGIIFHTKGYYRQNFRFNGDTKIGRHIKISTSNLFIKSISDRPGSNNSFFDLLFINPDVDLTAPNDDGSPYKILPDPWSIEENPLYPLYYRQRQRIKYSFLSNTKASWFVKDWLTLDAKYSFEKLFVHYNTYTPKGYLYGGGANIGGSLYKELYSSTNQVFQTTANFRKTLGDFNVKAKLSYMYEDEGYFDFAVTGRDFLIPGIPQLTNTDPTQSSLSSYDGAIRAIDFFGIVDFDYKSKYLFSGLLRRDGSSLFGANERWQTYYRLSGAYRITEDFKIPGFQELKIRAAYGTSGLRPGYSWQYETFYFRNGTVVRDQLGNENLKPAEARELELAMDAEFLKNFNFTISYSQTKTIGAFARVPLPSYLGFPYQWRNVGDIQSNVFELSLGIHAINTPRSKLYFQVNFDKVRQRMISLSIPPFYTGPFSAYYIVPGEDFGILYGYDWVRDLETMKRQLPEGMTIDDYTINSDGYVILAGTEGTPDEAPIPLDTNYVPGSDSNEPDKVLIGNANPDFHLNFSTNFSIGGFTLYFLIDWKQGGDIYNYTHQYTFRDARAIEFDQFGKPENQKKSLFYYKTFYQQSINSYFVEDGSFVKIRELSIYYTFNKKMFRNLVKSIRVGIVGRNVFTFTKYSGYDPEVATSGDLTTFAFDDFGYPNFRTISASLQFKF